jgi:hypothetical protein
MPLLKDLQEQDLKNLTLDEKKTIINEAVDYIFNDTLRLSKAVDMKASKILNNLMAGLDQQLKKEQGDENYELCFFINEIMWEIRNRLDKIKSNKDNGL